MVAWLQDDANMLGETDRALLVDKRLFDAWLGCICFLDIRIIHLKRRRDSHPHCFVLIESLFTKRRSTTHFGTIELGPAGRTVQLRVYTVKYRVQPVAATIELGPAGRTVQLRVYTVKYRVQPVAAFVDCH